MRGLSVRLRSLALVQNWIVVFEEFGVMSIGTESVVKQIVLSPSAFGPNEIVQIVSAIGKSYSNYRELREAAAELEEQPNRSPATSARLAPS